MTFSFATLKCR